MHEEMDYLRETHKLIQVVGNIPENELSDWSELFRWEKEGNLIGILKGSLLFFADLIRHIDLPILTDFLSVSSYKGNIKSSGNVTINNDITIPVKDKDLLIMK